MSIEWYKKYVVSSEAWEMDLIDLSSEKIYLKKKNEIWIGFWRISRKE